jgi:general secretion pathway protein F
MKFQYRALNREGVVVTGVLTIDDERAAIRQLQRQGLTPVKVASDVPKEAHRQTRRRAKTADLVVVMHQLTTLLKSGVSLDESVASLAKSIQHPQLRDAFEDISTQLRRGSKFSAALSSSKIKLPVYMYHLAEVGELTGNLKGALSEGVAQMEYEQTLRTELRNALVYPSILVVSGIASVLLIFTLVVPKFTKLLAKAKGDVPWLARAVLETGQFMNDNLTLVALATVASAALTVSVLNKPAARQRALDLLMRTPLVGPWLVEADIGRWSAMLGTLLASKVDLLRALQLAQQGVSGSRLSANLEQVTKAVHGGGSLSEALQESGAITATGYGLVRVGERSGQLPAMLRSLAALYTESGRNRMKRFLTLLEPISILTIGGVIGVIMTGIILAITSVNEITL